MHGIIYIQIYLSIYLSVCLSRDVFPAGIMGPFFRGVLKCDPVKVGAAPLGRWAAGGEKKTAKTGVYPRVMACYGRKVRESDDEVDFRDEISDKLYKLATSFSGNMSYIFPWLLVNFHGTAHMFRSIFRRHVKFSLRLGLRFWATEVFLAVSSSSHSWELKNTYEPNMFWIIFGG
jgi:hypothetical protein